MLIKLLQSLFPLLLILLLGTSGYMLIEGWTLFDSLYMTVITLTTVGYGETHPLSTGGKMFTVVLIIVGIGNVAYIFRNFSLEILNPFMGMVLNQKKMDKILGKIKDHYIVCGYGRIGRDVTRNLAEAGRKVVVVDLNRELEDDLTDKIPMLHGDASNEEVLEKAGILRAKGLVACVKSEAENVFITLTAREINPKLFIISRFEDESTQKKLLRAGADRVINPYHIGGRQISQIIIKPTISKILDSATDTGTLNLTFEELDLQSGHPLVGQSLMDSNLRSRFNVIILAIEKQGGHILSNPGANYTFERGDRVVMIADKEEFTKLFAEYA
ncbi:MAG: potassium channel protein [bacterium]|nr:potassium channel protein [bacterium]